MRTLPYNKGGGVNRKFWKESLQGNKILLGHDCCDCVTGRDVFSFKKYQLHWVCVVLELVLHAPIPLKVQYP